MKIDTQMRDMDLAQVAQEAQRFERMGFDAIWSFEAAHNPFLPLAAAALATQRIEIGTNITVAFARSPFALAQVAWDLQKASKGRFHLGIGTQVRAHVERRFSMPFDKPADRIADYIRCMKAVWDSFQNDTRPNYQGPFYQFRLITPFFSAGPIDHPEPPIYLAGVNRRMCLVAGELANGFHVHPVHSVSYLRDVVRPTIDEGARAAGRSIDDLELYASVFSVTGETEAERSRNEQQIREQIAFYSSTPNYRAFLEHHGYHDLGKKLSNHMRRGETAEMAKLIPDALMDEVVVNVAATDLGSTLRRRYDGLLARVSLYMPLPVAAPELAWSAFVKDFQSAA